VFTNFVPSGFFNGYINIDICIKKVTGPKRLRSIVLWLCCRTFFLFAFGAFFQDTAAHKALPIKSRRGTGARSSDITSLLLTLCKNVKKNNLFCRPSFYQPAARHPGLGVPPPTSCTFAVSFFYFYALWLYHASFKLKKTEMEEMR
jgi:hypothetical protein